MMGRLKSDQGQLFYEFHLGDAVPEDHLVRKIDTALDLSWLRSELARFRPRRGIVCMVLAFCTRNAVISILCKVMT